MALMDYKITSMVQNGSTTVVNLRYYVGAITTEDEYDFDSDANVPARRPEYRTRYQGCGRGAYADR